MNRLFGAVAGGLAAGAGITALMLLGEWKTGRPSELIDLERATAQRLGKAAPDAGALPSAREQGIAQGGHLALSALAGAAYAAVVKQDSHVLASGVGFGLAFYASMHWLAGPLLGVKPPEWKSGAGTIAMHTVNHVLFGLATAAGAKAASR